MGRRRAQRYSLQLGAHIVVGKERSPHEGQLKDISQGGALILLEEEVSFGSIVRLRLELDPEGKCEAMGRVLRSMSFDGRRGIAIEFAHVSRELLEFMEKLDAAFRRRGEPFLDYVRSVTVEIAAPGLPEGR